VGYQNLWQLFGLGALAGLIPVGLGILVAFAAKRVFKRTWEGFLIGISTGVLVYLFFDLMHEAVELTGAKDPVSWLAFLGSLLIGFVGLVGIEQKQQSRNRGAVSALFLPYMVALGMGLHNLGEGLAIGASYSQGAWVLSGILVSGFALHNGTEGFAILAAAGRTNVSATDMLKMTLLAGFPTCLGAMISGSTVSPYFTIICYALGAGSLLYVIFSMVTMFYTATRRVQTATGVFAGVSLMYITAMLLTIVTGIKS
jgi:zinc transporter, ZIP family